MNADASGNRHGGTEHLGRDLRTFRTETQGWPHDRSPRLSASRRIQLLTAARLRASDRGVRTGACISCRQEIDRCATSLQSTNAGRPSGLGGAAARRLSWYATLDLLQHGPKLLEDLDLYRFLKAVAADVIRMIQPREVMLCRNETPVCRLQQLGFR